MGDLVELVKLGRLVKPGCFGLWHAVPTDAPDADADPAVDLAQAENCIIHPLVVCIRKPVQADLNDVDVETDAVQCVDELADRDPQSDGVQRGEPAGNPGTPETKDVAGH